MPDAPAGCKKNVPTGQVVMIAAFRGKLIFYSTLSVDNMWRKIKRGRASKFRESVGMNR